MSTEQDIEVSLADKTEDFIKYLKHLDLLSLSNTRNVSFFTKPKDGEQVSGRYDSKLNISLNRKIDVVADANAVVIIKDKLKLAPAIISFNFNSSSFRLPVKSSFLCSFDSDVFNTLAAETGENNISRNSTVWYLASVKNRNEIDIDSLSPLSDYVITPKLQWKVYIPVASKMDSYAGGNMLYVHFPLSDSWMVVRFISLSSDTEGIQVINETESCVVDCNEIRWEPKFEELTCYTVNIADNDESLFNLSAVTDAADDVVEEFKSDADDPYIDESELEGSELHFLCGSEEDLESMLTLICHAGIPLQAWGNEDSLNIEIDSATDDGESAIVNYDSMDWSGSSWEGIKERLADKFEFIERAFDVALDNNQPCGHKWEYNDGAYDRKSGYDRSAERLTFTISAPSAHEQVCAKIEIQKLADVMSKALVDGLVEK